MKNIFQAMVDPNSRLIAFLARTCDLLLLNLLTIICSIPLVTIGASLAALHCVLLRMNRSDENTVVHSYFKAFKENFFQATTLYCILLLVSGLIVWWFFTLRVSQANDTLRMAGVFLLILLALCVLIIILYGFVLLTRFRNSTVQVIRNAILIAVANLPRSAGMIALLLTFIVVYCLLPVEVFAPLMALFGVSLPVWLCSKLYTPVFDRLETPEARKPSSQL